MSDYVTEIGSLSDYSDEANRYTEFCLRKFILLDLRRYIW